MKNYSGKSILIGVCSFMLVLITMPLGHALMILMEHFMTPAEVHYSAFAIGAAGIVMVITGIFVKGDTKQTLWGLFGGLLFWTGWVEFLFVYYAHRYDVQPLLDASGEVVTKPEYLLMPSSFGFWIMFMLLYLFNLKSGCDFFMYLQKKFFRKSKDVIKFQPMVRHNSLITFMELNLILWTSYLVLLFCYDDHFIGDRHPVTAIVAFGCLIASFFMFRRLLKVTQWGYAIRLSIATVIVFWTFVEVLGRWNFFREIWVHPMEYKNEMLILLGVFVALFMILIYNAFRNKKTKKV